MDYRLIGRIWRRDVSVWETKVAPILSVLIMLTLCAVILNWYTDITGTDGVYAQMPWMIPVVVVMGVVYARWLRKNRPQTYAILGQLSVNEGLGEMRDPGRVSV